MLGEETGLHCGGSVLLLGEETGLQLVAELWDPGSGSYRQRQRQTHYAPWKDVAPIQLGQLVI